MYFFEAAERDAACRAALADYDRFVRERIGPGYRFPLRQRDWELYQILMRLPAAPGHQSILETGSFNTFLGVWLARLGRVVISDLFAARFRKSLLRSLRLLPPRPTEAPFFTWRRAIRRAVPSAELRSVDLTRIPFPDSSFDLVTSVSVIEHIPAVERAVAEMFRCLKPGGRLLLTTDCSPEGKPFAAGERYFSPAELQKLFAPYPVTSPLRDPDFHRENWCYGKNQPILTAFVEITKPPV
jgi:SAM-dependent methyltransferase